MYKTLTATDLPETVGNENHLFSFTNSNLISRMSIPRLAFRGTDRKLVLAFDVGTTYSGISYRYGQAARWALLSDL